MVIQYIKDDWIWRFPKKVKSDKYGGIIKLSYLLLCFLYFVIKDALILCLYFIFRFYRFVFWDIGNWFFRIAKHIHIKENLDIYNKDEENDEIDYKNDNYTANTIPAKQVNGNKIAKNIDYSFIYLLEEFFEDNKDLLYPSMALKEYNLRKAGKMYTIDNHCEALILAKLSNMQKWYRIEENLNSIQNIFYNYNVKNILDCDETFFIDKIKSIKCGTQVTVRDFNNLHQNILVLMKLEQEYGSVDNFLYSYEPYEIVKILSDPKSNLKMNTIGPALAWEYLRNVGIDGAKPDTHLKRILAVSRLHLSENENISDDEFYKIMTDMHNATNKLYIELDNYLWSYCAVGQAEICTASPKCEKCVIKKYCNQNK